MKAYIFVREMNDEVPGKIISAASVQNDVGTHFSRAYEPNFGFSRFGSAAHRIEMNMRSRYGKPTTSKMIFVMDEGELRYVERFIESTPHAWPLQVEEYHASSHLKEAL